MSYVTNTNWNAEQIAKARATHHRVEVRGKIYNSVYQAFVALDLPISQHQAFRKTLKLRKKLVFNYGERKVAFAIVAKEPSARHVRRRTAVPRARMRQLHIVQGGIDNGDKTQLERAARLHLDASTWVVPRRVAIGDDVVVYVAGFGFFATARIKSSARPRQDWKNRWGSGLEAIRLIDPPISIAAIQRHLPKLQWANYPRSITTPSPEIAAQVRTLIKERRKTRLPDLDDSALDKANLSELRKVALLNAKPFLTSRQGKRIFRARSRAIHLYVLRRSGGHCEGCKGPAPFLKPDGTPYLEPHHITRVADDGPDHPAKVIGLCPTCHRRAHHSKDKAMFNLQLKKALVRLEPQRA